MSSSRTIPLYQQVAERLVAGLRPQATAGQRLPSERALCAQLDVSRVTLRAALDLLARQGVIVSSPARGWFATDPSGWPGDAADVAGSAERVNGFSDAAAARGQATEATVLRAAVQPSTLDEAEQLGLVPGAPIFSLRRLRRLQGLIIAVDHSRVPLALVPDIAEHDYSSTSLYQVLRNASPAVRPTTADYAVEAVAPSAEEAASLELPPGVPLLVATQRTRDQFGRVCELGRTAYRGDRYRFRATLGGR